MYLNSDYHNYKYLVDYGDNYVLLSTSSAIYGESGDKDTIYTLLHYFSPSDYDIMCTYSSYDTSRFPDISSTFTDSIYDRRDFPSIFICGFILFIFIIFIFNQLSKLVKKGGIFGY